MRTSLLVVPVVAFAACLHAITPVSYAPQPLRVHDARGEIKSIILGNTVQGCVTEPEFTDASLLVVKAVCSYGVGNQVVHLDRVKNIVLEQDGEWYRCRVTHSSGDDFWWSSKSLEDMQHMADAFAALTSVAPAKGAPAASSM
jgi:hypothetical protein